MIEGNTVTFASIELIDQDGEVIDLEALNLGEEITVTLPLPESAPFAAGDEVVIYHDGRYVATATVDANGKISYGVAHLCQVSVGAIESPTVNEENNTVEIANVSQLLAFARSVNVGNNYKGQTVVLTEDIDLNNIAWTPIASESNPFKGVFDGDGHTIKNLYIDEPDADCVAFFGFIDKTTIKNFTIENVNAHGAQRVAAVVGATNPSALIDNVHVKGDIKIVADTYYAAGIVTHGYVNVTNCSVIADGRGLIDGNGGMVGGICGWRGEGNTVLTNCHVKNIDMIGRASIGGLAALIHYNNTISDCSVEDVTLTKTRIDGWGSIGALSGNWGGVDKAGKAVYTVTNNTIKNVTLNGTAIKIFSEIYGSKYSSPEAEMPLVESGNTFENITSNLKLVTKVTTTEEAQAALDNATPGTIIYLAAGVDFGTLYLRPTADGAPTKEVDWIGNNYRWETYTLFEDLTIIGDPTATVDAIVIEGGTYYNTAHSQSETYPIMLSLVELKNVVIEGVTFTGNGGFDPQGHGNAINLSGNNIKVDGLTLKNCTLKNEDNNARLLYKTESTTHVHTYAYGGNTYTFSPSLKNITVTGCTFDGGYIGIELRETENLTITDNVFNVADRNILLPINSGCAYTGTVTITGNVSNNAQERFVRADGMGDAVVVITGNTLNNYAGADEDYIKVTNANNVTIENNVKN